MRLPPPLCSRAQALVLARAIAALAKTTAACIATRLGVSLDPFCPRFAVALMSVSTQRRVARGGGPIGIPIIKGANQAIIVGSNRVPMSDGLDASPRPNCPAGRAVLLATHIARFVPAAGRILPVIGTLLSPMRPTVINTFIDIEWPHCVTPMTSTERSTMIRPEVVTMSKYTTKRMGPRRSSCLVLVRLSVLSQRAKDAICSVVSLTCIRLIPMRPLAAMSVDKPLPLGGRFRGSIFPHLPAHSSCAAFFLEDPSAAALIVSAGCTVGQTL